jgi:hypothetical protein
MENEEKRNVKCKRCGTYRYPSQFFSKGRELKTCQVCRDKEKIRREKNKCPHGRKRNMCKECGGASICEHNRLRNTCKECDGASICEHGRRRITCKECDGSQICQHNRMRNTCKDCMNHEQKLEYIQKTMILSSRQHDKEYNRINL